MKYIIIKHTFKKTGDKIYRQRSYYKGVGVVNNQIVELWEANKEAAKTFNDKISAERLLYNHNLISDTDWKPFKSNLYKNSYQIKKLKETKNEGKK